MIVYSLIASYVDYEFGFIKRGLFSEFCYLLQIPHIVILKIMTYLGCFVFVATMTYQFKDKLSDENNFITYLVLILSPLFIKNYLYDVGRADILFFIMFIFVGFMRYRTATILFLLYPVMVLIHEAIAVMFLPSLLFVYWVRFGEKKYTKIMIFGNVFLFAVISLLVVKFGNPDVPIKMMQDYILSQKQNFNVKLIPTGKLLHFYLNHWYASFWEHFVSSSDSKYLLPILKNIHNILFLCAIHYTVFKVVIKTLCVDGKTLSLLMFLTSGYILLMFLAFDRTRFTADMFGILMICAMVKNKELLFVSLRQTIMSYSISVRFLLISMTIAIPYVGIGVPDLF